MARTAPCILGGADDSERGRVSGRKTVYCITSISRRTPDHQLATTPEKGGKGDVLLTALRKP